ncbi:ABC transporter permease [bacterium]|nr:ABC transporter permease [candidate division CSSED10-310 bacterium]
MPLTRRNHWELLVNFTTRNLKLKYKGSILGFLWSLITPLLQMLIYTIVFSLIIRVETNQPFAVFLLTTQLPWIFFASSLQMGAGSIVEHSNLVKKVYFPRELIPISTLMSNMISFLITLLVLAVFLICYNQTFTAHILLLPLAICLLAAFTMGLTFITSCLAIFFRDIFHILEVLLLFWFWSLPIVYPLEYLHKNLPEGYLWLERLYKMNPMVEILELFRFAFFNTKPYENWPPLKYILYASIWALVSLMAGYWLFKKLEPRFAREI